MRKMNRSRGSIMIWTLLLGISLATVFFFFAQRLGANVASQRETMEYQSTKIFFESYIAYLEGLGLADLNTIKAAGDINLEGISGTVTNEVTEITGVLDAGESVTYGITGDGTEKAKIEWDHCDDQDDLEILDVDPNIGVAETDCPPGDIEYDNYAESIAATFDLEATAAPVSYRILPMTEPTVLLDNKWQIDLEMSLGFRKKLTVQRTFIPIGL